MNLKLISVLFLVSCLTISCHKKKSEEKGAAHIGDKKDPNDSSASEDKWMNPSSISTPTNQPSTTTPTSTSSTTNDPNKKPNDNPENKSEQTLDPGGQIIVDNKPITGSVKSIPADPNAVPDISDHALQAPKTESSGIVLKTLGDPLKYDPQWPEKRKQFTLQQKNGSHDTKTPAAKTTESSTSNLDAQKQTEKNNPAASTTGDINTTKECIRVTANEFSDQIAKVNPPSDQYIGQMFVGIITECNISDDDSETLFPYLIANMESYLSAKAPQFKNAFQEFKKKYDAALKSEISDQTSDKSTNQPQQSSGQKLGSIPNIDLQFSNFEMKGTKVNQSDRKKVVFEMNSLVGKVSSKIGDQAQASSTDINANSAQQLQTQFSFTTQSTDKQTFSMSMIFSTDYEIPLKFKFLKGTPENLLNNQIVQIALDQESIIKIQESRVKGILRSRFPDFNPTQYKIELTPKVPSTSMLCALNDKAIICNEPNYSARIAPNSNPPAK